MSHFGIVPPCPVGRTLGKTSTLNLPYQLALKLTQGSQAVS